ncbi:hypothetical protein ASPSYDRAFT_33919 [Aspergillus sydowii CBS 593.65]|uniref:Uncharacterized protein n=1 Tax=Aspergillus sydowii CBS 593.65 TaxID=1036612 RepID=A0A1L9T8Y7_9EURO|nr:uncharacterized protein ASPSYDRAFT_33919 [Aspergillus sydowii CBS 593.65]OJJ55908.1 hypothetical protein ASPSYDRAFT_33919 [Aspergillus sydowii CBS 593.65]
MDYGIWTAVELPPSIEPGRMMYGPNLVRKSPVVDPSLWNNFGGNEPRIQNLRAANPLCLIGPDATLEPRSRPWNSRATAYGSNHDRQTDRPRIPQSSQPPHSSELSNTANKEAGYQSVGHAAAQELWPDDVQLVNPYSFGTLRPPVSKGQRPADPGPVILILMATFNPQNNPRKLKRPVALTLIVKARWSGVSGWRLIVASRPE